MFTNNTGSYLLWSPVTGYLGTVPDITAADCRQLTELLHQVHQCTGTSVLSTVIHIFFVAVLRTIVNASQNVVGWQKEHKHEIVRIDIIFFYF